MLRNNNDPISAPPTPPPPPPASQRKGFHFSLFGLGSSSPSSSSSPPPPHPSASTNPIPSPQSSGSSHSSHEHASLAPAQSGQTLWPSDTAHPPDGADRSASASASALTSTSPSSSTSHGSSSSGGEGGGVRRTPSLVSRISRASSTQFGAQFKSLFRSASSRGLKHSASSAAISPVPATAAAAPTATFIHPAHVSAPDHHGGDHFADAMGSYGSPPPAPVAATRELYAPQPVKATGKRWSVADLRAAVTDIEASSETGLNTSYDSAAREHDDLHRHAAAHRDAMAASPSSPSRFLASRKSVLDLFSGNNATPPPPSDGMNPLLTAISETPPASEGSLGEPLASIPVTIADTLVLGSAPPMAEGHAPHHTGSYKKSGARPGTLFSYHCALRNVLTWGEPYSTPRVVQGHQRRHDDGSRTHVSNPRGLLAVGRHGVAARWLPEQRTLCGRRIGGPASRSGPCRLPPAHVLA
ncbi:hypothetical protein BC828DRAFT_193472 [Blastocladiella britannica]|nr:hypothetical protein BC828DRAFT_193472 [Blastocladiella britannica]